MVREVEDYYAALMVECSDLVDIIDRVSESELNKVRIAGNAQTTFAVASGRQQTLIKDKEAEMLEITK